MAAQPPRSPTPPLSPTSDPPSPKRVRTSPEPPSSSFQPNHANTSPDNNNGHHNYACSCECQCQLSDNDAEDSASNQADGAENGDGSKAMEQEDEDGSELGKGEEEVSDSGEETLEVEYWDSLYEANAEQNTNSEYLLSYFTLRPLLLSHLYLLRDDKEQPKHAESHTPEETLLLVPGCGDSSLAECLDAEGFEVHASDTATSVIAIMQNKAKETCGVNWVVDDATKMEYGNNVFHFIVDKSLIDCIYWVKDPEVRIDEVIQQTLSEYYRTLNPAGCAIIVTIRDREEFLPFIDKKIQHTHPDFRRRRAGKQVPEPADWVYLCNEILAERIDGAVPTNAVAIELESEEEPELDKEKDYAKFYMYVLRKR